VIETLVRAEDLSRSFPASGGDVFAVTDATFVIRSGDRIALVGPSGSGKSTLLHLIAGLDRPTEGTIGWPAFGTQDLLRPKRVRVAFQGPSLLPQLTVVENVALPLLLAGSDETDANEASLRCLRDMTMSDLAQKLPSELSGGQLQRAGIARAFVGTPGLVLADEPTGQQDRAGGAALLEMMFAGVLRIGAALVVATHDAAVADRFVRRWSMRDGRLSQDSD
jgi:predicted ABC-type transport system involved in lysophospholipase L1 biosynthesis ATPase subunit